jgi:hypothetical protein
MRGLRPPGAPWFTLQRCPNQPCQSHTTKKADSLFRLSPVQGRGNVCDSDRRSQRCVLLTLRLSKAQSSRASFASDDPNHARWIGETARSLKSPDSRPLRDPPAAHLSKQRCGCNRYDPGSSVGLDSSDFRPFRDTTCCVRTVARTDSSRNPSIGWKLAAQPIPTETQTARRDGSLERSQGYRLFRRQ